MNAGQPMVGYCAEGALEGHYVADPVTANRALCGRLLVWVPLNQAPPAVLHWRCMDALRRGAEPARADDPDPDLPIEGVCPDCGQTVALDGSGLIVPHTVARTKTPFAPCFGAGQHPEDTE